MSDNNNDHTANNGHINQREHTRYSTRLSATLSSSTRAPITGDVLDYGAGGLFIQVDPASFEVGQKIILHVDAVPGEVPITIDVKVARLTANGVGLSFAPPRQPGVDQLLNVVHEQGELGEAHGSRPELLTPLINRCTDFLGDLVKVFVSKADKLLGDNETLARSNWRLLVDSQLQLRKSREQITEQLIGRLRDDFVAGSTSHKNPAAVGGGELSLVQDDDFQSWLDVVSLANRVHAISEETLFALEHRMAIAVPFPMSHSTNPVGAHALMEHLGSLVDKFPLGAAHKTVARAIEQTLLEMLPPFYKELNDWLVGQGVLPEIKRHFSVVKKEGGGVSRPAVGQGAVAGAAQQTAVPAGVAAAPAPTANAAAGTSQQVAQKTSADGAAATTNENVESAGGQSPSTGAEQVAVSQADNATPRASSEMFSGAGAGRLTTVNELVRLQRLEGTEAGATPANGESSSAAAAELNKNEVAALVSELWQQGVSFEQLERKGGIARALHEASGADGRGRQLSGPVRDKLEVAERLLDTIQKDEVFDSSVKEAVAKLAMPLMREVVENDAILEDEKHPVYQVLNDADHLGRILPDDEGGQQNRQLINRLINELASRGTLDSQQVSKTASQLEQLKSRHEEAYKSAVKRLVARCEEEEKPRHVRLDVLSDIDAIFARRNVPLSLLKLMDSGLKNLIIHTYTHHGKEHQSYRQALQVLKLLQMRLTVTGALKGDEPTLLHRIGQQLVKMKGSDSSLVNASVTALQDDVNQAAAGHYEAIATKQMSAVRGQLARKWLRERIGERPSEYGESNWQNWLNKARGIALNDTISSSNDGQSPQQFQLVWSDRLRSRFVFADRKGNQGLSLTLGELATHMAAGHIILLEGWDRPLMDRVASKMLQSLHNQILEQANTDALTGLINRRSFEQRLDDELKSAAESGKALQLCYFDLDNFSVINNTCGHEAGDQLIADVAKHLESSANEQMLLSRLGGDEFAVLFSGFNAEEAKQHVESLRAGIRAHQFRCQENTFTITASFGLVTVDPVNDTVSSLLKAVDSACYTAKQAGRDRIETYASDNAAVQKLIGSMAWVGRIDKAFDEGRVRFKCQKIAPVRFKGVRPHYEILLDIRDEADNPIPLEEFIIAAEHYDRIRDIDRWASTKILDWLLLNRDNLSKISGVAMNLSGNSVNDGQFMLELLERLENEPIPVDKLIVEITETAAISNLDDVVDLIRRFKAAGVKVALDDFGSGQASYSYLKALPVDYLKIDGSLIRGIAVDIYDFAVVKSVVEIGRTLGKRVVAEYVEDSLILNKLEEIGVDYAQGYFIEKPIPMEQLLG